MFQSLVERSAVVQTHGDGQRPRSTHAGAAMRDDVATSNQTLPHDFEHLGGSIDIG